METIQKPGRRDKQEYPPAQALIDKSKTLVAFIRIGLPTGNQLTINNHIAEIKIHPSGKFLYVSNRGHDSIALFHCDQKTGMIRFIECVNSKGEGPISFTIEPKGRHLYCANRKSSNITTFRINPETGKLTPASQTISVPVPVCLTIFNKTVKP